jgi:hypothetical protein
MTGQSRRILFFGSLLLIAACSEKSVPSTPEQPAPTGAVAPSVPAPTGAVAAREVIPDFPSQAPEHWLNGAPLPLSRLKGKVVLLSVFDSADLGWTQTARDQLKQFEARGLRIIGVARGALDDEARTRITEAMKPPPFAQRVYLDVDGAWSTAAGVRGIPEILVVGPDRKLLHRYEGGTSQPGWSAEHLSSTIERAFVEYSSQLENVTVADFSSLQPDRWVNGSPTSLTQLRDHVVLLEVWHPT